MRVELFPWDVEKSVEYHFLCDQLLPSFTNQVSSDLKEAEDNAILNIDSGLEEEHFLRYRSSCHYEVNTFVGVRATQEETGSLITNGKFKRGW